MLKKPLVYIASPYTKGDPAINTRFQCEMFHKMWMDGIVTPFAPLWSHFQHILFPISYEEWVDYDNQIIPRCDALIRLIADYRPINYRQRDSSGADAEVDLARALNIPTFTDIEALYQWARTEYQDLASKPSAPVPSAAPTATGNDTT